MSTQEQQPTKALAEQQPTKALAFNPKQGGLQLTSTEDMLGFARSLLREGLCPQGLKTAGQVVIALQAGAEVGLKPMQSLRYIVPINGSPTIWGEGAKGLVTATGEVEGWEEWWGLDGERQPDDFHPSEFPDSLTRVCHLARRGGAKVTRMFSVLDAKRARLWGKRGPWTEHPQRMLTVRPMAAAMRDLFADALGGLAIREEIRDLPPADRESDSYTTLKQLGLQESSATPAPRTIDAVPVARDEPEDEQFEDGDLYAEPSLAPEDNPFSDSYQE